MQLTADQFVQVSNKALAPDEEFLLEMKKNDRRGT